MRLYTLNTLWEILFGMLILQPNHYTKKMVDYHLFVGFSTLLCTLGETQVQTMLHVSRERGSVLLQCCGQNAVSNKWKYGGTTISYNKHIFDRMDDFVSIFANYSLLFKTVLFIHEGEYECVRDSSVVSRHLLVVQGLSWSQLTFFHCSVRFCDVGVLQIYRSSITRNSLEKLIFSKAKLN